MNCRNNKKKFSGQTREQYTYVANEYSRRLVEDGKRTRLTNMNTARRFPVVYQVFNRKQYILCSALLHKSYGQLRVVIDNKPTPSSRDLKESILLNSATKHTTITLFTL